MLALRCMPRKVSEVGGPSTLDGLMRTLWVLHSVSTALSLCSQASVLYLFTQQHYTYLCSSIILIYAAVYIYLPSSIYAALYLYSSIMLIYAAALIYYYTYICKLWSTSKHNQHQIIGMRIRDSTRTKPTRHGKLFMTHYKHVTKGSCIFNNAAINWMHRMLSIDVVS